jgi:hypothetical protein
MLHPVLARSRSAVALALVAVAACAAPPPPATPPARIVALAAPAAPAPPPEPEEPLLPREEAVGLGRSIVARWKEGPRYDDAKRDAWLRDEQLDERRVRRLLLSVARPCLDQPGREAPACVEINDSGTPSGEAAEGLVELLAETAAPAPSASASARLLARLEARGFYRADLAQRRILERRSIASPGLCAPPGAGEIEAAKRALADFAIADGVLAARWPSAVEMDDLAYFYASIANAGPEVGHFDEERGAKPLPVNHPDLTARAGLRDEMRAALGDGDLERHARASDAYLRTLGYPGPIRAAEEGSMAWGGASFSFVMRDAARSAEILGRYELAEALYRRAAPGGGACGTSTPSRRDGQIAGAVRAAELRRGCRAAVAERLFAIALDIHHAHGPERLARAGFDVGRLYAGALLTVGRDDPARLDRALRALPARSGDALARLGRLGPEAWATRVRAIPGYADTARGAGLDRLLAIAEHGPDPARAEAIDSIGLLAEDHGYDPCIKSSLGFGWGHGSSSRLERKVRGVMSTCATRIDAAAIERAARRIAALAADPIPSVREAVAVALGRIASPHGKNALALLARDTFDAGGQICTIPPSGPQVCSPNRPIARAAHEAQKALVEADARRAQQRAARPAP